jgi:hypothetical protein
MELSVAGNFDPPAAASLVLRSQACPTMPATVACIFVKKNMKIQCKYCVHVYVNTKTRPAIPGMGEGGKRRIMVEGVDSSRMYLIHCKNFCKCHNVPPPSTAIKKKTGRSCFCQT